MRWQGRQQSRNVEDRRGGGSAVGRVGKIGGIGGIIIALIALLLGGDPNMLLEQLQSSGGPAPSEQAAPNPNDELGSFVKVVLKETEDTWNTIFREEFGADYREPILVLFDGSTPSPCGYASAATGPFYCPGDDKIYIDLSFYGQLRDRFGAPGDFAMAYVVAHEVAHHVQNLMGITEKVQRQRGSISQKAYNDLSVRLELQADFMAGVWAHHTQQKGLLEKGDLEEALRAAHAIGDDRLQKQSQGYVVPDSFTHGTSEQRMRWFKKGYDTGDIRQGDTFAARTL